MLLPNRDVWQVRPHIPQSPNLRHATTSRAFKSQSTHTITKYHKFIIIIFLNDWKKVGKIRRLSQLFVVRYRKEKEGGGVEGLFKTKPKVGKSAARKSALLCLDPSTPTGEEVSPVPPTIHNHRKSEKW